MAEDMQAITVRLPKDVYEALRLAAFQRRASQASIVVEAVRKEVGALATPETVRDDAVTAVRKRAGTRKPPTPESAAEIAAALRARKENS